MPSSGGLDMSDSEYTHTPGLKEGRYARVTKMYLDTGLPRKAVDALDLENDGQLESVVLQLRDRWGSVVSEINRLRKESNEESGELSANAETAEIFIFGRDVAGTAYIDGDTMFQAIKNMAVFVVDRAKKLQNEKQRLEHQWIVIAMFVEAIHALQYDWECGFRGALLAESLRKVKAYKSSQQGYGETVDQFRVRMVKNELATERACGQKRYQKLEDGNYWFKQKNKNLEDLIREMKDELKVLPGQVSVESDFQFEVRHLDGQLKESKVREVEKFQENRQLKMELGLGNSRWNMSEGKRDDLEIKLERRDLEVLQLKQNVEVVRKLSELKLEEAKNAFQEKILDAECTNHLLSDEVEEQAHKIESLANNIESQAKKIESQAKKIKNQAKKLKARENKSARRGAN
jgi:hypothetical protein